MTAAASPPSNVRLFRHAALLTCLAIALNKLMAFWFLGATALPFLHLPLSETVMALAAGSEGHLETLFGSVLVMYVLSFCLFALILYRLTDPSIQQRTGGHVTLMAAQIGLALFTDDKLLVLVAAEFALVLQRRQALAWLAGQMLVTTLMHLLHGSHEPGQQLLCMADGSDISPFSADPRLLQRILGLALTLICQVIAFGIGDLGATEQRRRVQLAAAHAQLLATGQLLAETTRASERIRVARELHDAIGHHLMALNLHLDLALRRAGESGVPAPVRASHALTQALLATVRRVVRSERCPDSDPGATVTGGAGAT